MERAPATRGGVLADGLAAGAATAALSGLPSTLHGLLVTGRPLDPAMAAGSVLAPRAERPGTLLAAGLVAHAAMSLGLATVLARVLPRRGTIAAGAGAGLALAAFDLGPLARRVPAIRALPLWPQVADHLAYGAVAGAVIARRRARRRARAARV